MHCTYVDCSYTPPTPSNKSNYQYGTTPLASSWCFGQPNYRGKLPNYPVISGRVRITLNYNLSQLLKDLLRPKRSIKQHLRKSVASEAKIFSFNLQLPKMKSKQKGRQTRISSSRVLKGARKRKPSCT